MPRTWICVCSNNLITLSHSTNWSNNIWTPFQIYLALANDFDPTSNEKLSVLSKSILRNESYLGSTTTNMCFVMCPTHAVSTPTRSASIGHGQSTRVHTCSKYQPQVKGLLHHPTNRYFRRHVNRIHQTVSRLGIPTLSKVSMCPSRITK